MSFTVFSDDAWLSGFIDGEGCFTHDPHGPRFKIGLRWDDADILYSLAAEFGGAVYDNANKRVGNRQPARQWTLWRRSDLLGLVEYLERYPLRAKKARQFEAWCERWGFARADRKGVRS